MYSIWVILQLQLRLDKLSQIAASALHPQTPCDSKEDARVKCTQVLHFRIWKSFVICGPGITVGDIWMRVCSSKSFHIQHTWRNPPVSVHFPLARKTGYRQAALRKLRQFPWIFPPPTENRSERHVMSYGLCKRTDLFVSASNIPKLDKHSISFCVRWPWVNTLSGWYFRASRRKARFTSSSVGSLSRPSTLA